jgi:hypothetical protein
MRTSNVTNQSKEIKNLWQIIEVHPNSIIEIRAILNRYSSSSLFRGSQFSSVSDLKEAVEDEALRLNNLKYNVYIVMNPISHGFKGGSASDDDIECRKLLLIDIDRAKTSKEPASNQELVLAKLLAKDVAKYLKAEGMYDPIVVMSGNGYHLYYKLDSIPNTSENAAKAGDFLRRLAAKFDNDEVKIDTCVYNASRITKVVGTISRKGVETVDRPYRMAEVVSW